MNYIQEKYKEQSQWSYQPFRPSQPDWLRREPKTTEIKESNQDKKEYRSEPASNPKKES